MSTVIGNRSILPHHGRHHGHGRGLTLVEVLMAMLVTGIMLVVVLNTVGGVYKNVAIAREQQQAGFLAEALMAEIQQMRYEDPDGSAVFGTEPNESSVMRTHFDDVDDYNGWIASPPQARDGTDLAGTDNWTRQVTVERVHAMNVHDVQAAETGLKRITVTVTSPRKVPYSLTGLRSAAGALEYRPPLNQTYITGVEIQLQQENNVTQNVHYVSLNNHAQDE